MLCETNKHEGRSAVALVNDPRGNFVRAVCRDCAPTFIWLNSRRKARHAARLPYTVTALK